MSNTWSKTAANNSLTYTLANGVSTVTDDGTKTGSYQALLNTIDNAQATLTSRVKTDGTPQSVEMQAEIDALWAMGGGHGGTYVLKDGATYVCEGLIIRPGITIKSENIFGTFTEGASEWTGARIRPPLNSTKPMLLNDLNNGYVRATPSFSPNPNQRYAKIAILGVLLGGYTNLTNHTSNCDLLRLESCWGVTLRNVQITNSRGFGIRAIDCNVLDIDSCFGCNAPWYFNSLADSSIRNCQNGGGNGFASSVVWIDGTSWKNQFLNNFFYNNNNNGLVTTNPRKYAFRMTAGTIDTTANTITFSGNNVNTDANHYWQDGTPVVVQTTGTLPSGLTSMKTYYVKVVSATSIRLCSSLYNLRLSTPTYVSLGSVGSGTIWVTVGPEANLAITDGSQKNVFSGRFDQAHQYGVLIDAAPRNLFVGVTAQENSYGNYTGANLSGDLPTVAPTPVAAIRVQNSSVANVFSSAQIDGAKAGTLGTTTDYESRQKFGLSIDSSSIPGTTVERGWKCINHLAANSEAGALDFAEARCNPNVWIYTAEDIGARFSSGGTPALGDVSGNRRVGWLLDANTNETIGTTLLPMAGVNRINVRVGYVNAGAGTGGVVFGMNFDWFAVGADTNVAPILSPGNVTVTAAAQNIMSEAVFSNINISAADGLPVFFRLTRLATDAADTLANDIAVMYVAVEQVIV